MSGEKPGSRVRNATKSTIKCGQKLFDKRPADGTVILRISKNMVPQWATRIEHHSQEVDRRAVRGTIPLGGCPLLRHFRLESTRKMRSAESRDLKDYRGTSLDVRPIA